MKGIMDAGDPSFTGGDDTQNTGGGRMENGLVFYLLLLLLIFILCYTSYICKRSTTAFMDDDDHHFVRLAGGGLHDDILSTFPTFIYKAGSDNSYGSGCSICLADYRPTEVLRLLPECGHYFHVGCIDRWLKVHPTCPVCRNSIHFTQE